jgi:hypothetical protein
VNKIRQTIIVLEEIRKMRKLNRRERRILQSVKRRKAA